MRTQNVERELRLANHESVKQSCFPGWLEGSRGYRAINCPLATNHNRSLGIDARENTQMSKWRMLVTVSLEVTIELPRTGYGKDFGAKV